MQTADGRFGYIAAGDAKAPPLVFLHGIGGAGRAWAAQADAFSAQWRTVAWDMPGYGGSRPLDNVTFPTLAAALRDFLNALGLVDPVLVGHSIGGMIVQRFIVDYPARARAIVLSGTSPAFGKPDGDWQKHFIEARLGPLDRGATMAELGAGLVGELVGDNPDPEGLKLAVSTMAAGSESAYRAMMMALLGFDMKADLERIALPCLVLAGEKDGNAPAGMMERMAGRIPGAAYAMLPGAGHLANMEQPAAFNAALGAFLDTLGDRKIPA